MGNGRLTTRLAHRLSQLGLRKGRELVDAPTLVRRALHKPFVAPGVESAQQRQLPRRATHLGKQAQHHRATVSSSEREGLPVSDDVGQLLPKGVSLAGPRACVGGPGGELRQVTRGWRHLAWAEGVAVSLRYQSTPCLVLGLRAGAPPWFCVSVSVSVSVCVSVCLCLCVSVSVCAPAARVDPGAVGRHCGAPRLTQPPPPLRAQSAPRVTHRGMNTPGVAALAVAAAARAQLS